jgi:hypothetical protein
MHIGQTELMGLSRRLHLILHDGVSLKSFVELIVPHEKTGHRSFQLTANISADVDTSALSVRHNSLN